MQSRERWFAIIFLARAAIGAPIAWNLYFQPLHAGELYVLLLLSFPALIHRSRWLLATPIWSEQGSLPWPQRPTSSRRAGYRARISFCSSRWSCSAEASTRMAIRRMDTSCAAAACQLHLRPVVLHPLNCRPHEISEGRADGVPSGVLLERQGASGFGRSDRRRLRSGFQGEGSARPDRALRDSRIGARHQDDPGLVRTPLFPQQLLVHLVHDLCFCALAQCDRFQALLSTLPASVLDDRHYGGHLPHAVQPVRRHGPPDRRMVEGPGRAARDGGGSDRY
ncbi:hypothetical protein ABIA41_002673 [Bradyrhizobium sp. USDA 313]